MEDDPLLRALLDPAALALARETAAVKGLIKGRSASALGGFAQAMLGLAATACVRGVPALLDAVLMGEDVDLMGAVGAPAGAPAPIAKLARQRQRRLEEMRETAAAEFGEGPAWGGALGRYVEEAALMASDDDEEEEALEEGEAATKVLKLMTVHKAKGLEFDAVFVAGLETRRWGGWADNDVGMWIGFPHAQPHSDMPAVTTLGHATTQTQACSAPGTPSRRKRSGGSSTWPSRGPRPGSAFPTAAAF